MIKYFALTFFVFFLGIHGPLLANTEVFEGSSKYISTASNVHEENQKNSRATKSTSCGIGFMLYRVGEASWYGEKFHGKTMANGKPFDMHKHTIAAYPPLKLGTTVCLINTKTNASIMVKLTDRGGFKKYDRVVDVSKAVATKLGFVADGTANLRVYVKNI